MVSNQKKNMSEHGNLPQIGVKIYTCLKLPPSHPLEVASPLEGRVKLTTKLSVAEGRSELE